MTMKRAIVASAVVLSLAGGVFAFRAANRPDCPGKIICPLTGEVICADQCPATTAAAAAETPACCKTEQ